MFYFKGCPRCHGDVYESNDMFGPYTSCMQCSHYLTDAEDIQLKHFPLSPALQRSTVVGMKRYKSAEWSRGHTTLPREDQYLGAR